MDIGSDIALSATGLKLSQAAGDVSMAVAKKVLDQQEVAAQEVQRLMPQIPKGQYIDVYA